MPAEHQAHLSDQTMLVNLLRQQKGYSQNAQKRAELSSQHTTVTTISGPFGVGKTTITDLGVQQAGELAPIGTRTNRQRKESDPPEFRTKEDGVTLEELYEDIQAGIVINYITIGDTAYATYNESLTAKHNIGPFVTDSLPTLLQSNVEHQNHVYIISPGRMLATFINKSMSERHDSVAVRVPESIASLEFALKNQDLFTFVENRKDEGLQKAVDAVIAIATGGSYPTLAPDLVEHTIGGMIKTIRSLEKHA